MKEVSINGKKHQVKQFTLGNFPEVMDAQQQLSKAKTSREKCNAMAALIAAAYEIDLKICLGLSFKEASDAVNAVMEENAVSPKAKAPSRR